jgi:hypothetical protein
MVYLQAPSLATQTTKAFDSVLGAIAGRIFSEGCVTKDSQEASSMRIHFAIAAIAVAALSTATRGFAHHSNVAFEVTKVVTVTGVVKAFEWRNPHTWVILTVDDGKGGEVDWGIEGRAPGVLLRAGWTRNSLQPGEMITVDMSPAKDGSKTGLVARVTKADGTILPNAGPAQQ